MPSNFFILLKILSAKVAFSYQIPQAPLNNLQKSLI